MGAPSTFNMLAPGATAYWSFHDRNGLAITADATGALTGLTYPQFRDAEAAGCTLYMAGQSPPQPSYKEDSATDSKTLSSADITESVDQTLAMTGAASTGALTMAAAATVASWFPGAVAQGAVFKLRIINRNSNAVAWTVTVDSPATWTLNGTMSVNQNTWRDFLVTIAKGGLTGTIQAMGTGTDS